MSSRKCCGCVALISDGTVVQRRRTETFFARVVEWQLRGEDPAWTLSAPRPDVAPHRLLLLATRLVAELTATEDGRLYLVNATTLFGHRDASVQHLPLSGIATLLWHLVLSEVRRHDHASPHGKRGDHRRRMQEDWATSRRSLSASYAPIEAGGDGVAHAADTCPHADQDSKTTVGSQDGTRANSTNNESCLLLWALVAVERLRYGCLLYTRWRWRA